MEDLIEDLICGRRVDSERLKKAITEFCDGEFPPEQLAALLVAMRCRGETAEQLVGFAQALISKAHTIEVDDQVVDHSGTGGDHSGSFNISTTAALLTAACGVPVAKHGNRSVTSQSGSSDVLQALGVNVNMEPTKAKACLDNTGFVFLFAPLYHPAFKQIAPVRQAMKIRTLFNVMGPLLNPARVKRQVIGVYDQQLLVIIAEAVLQLNNQRVMVVSSSDGMDEISMAAPSHAKLVEDGVIRDLVIDPKDFGFNYCGHGDLLGGDAQRNADITKAVLSGEQGPRTDCVVLNSAASIYVGGRVENLAQGVELARSVQQSGQAIKLLENVVSQSNA